MKKKCPYCKKLSEVGTAKYYGEYYISCANHGSTNVDIYFSQSNQRTVVQASFSNDKYNFILDKLFLKKEMFLSLEDGEEVQLPYDESLTPENFEQKLKLYLTFM